MNGVIKYQQNDPKFVGFDKLKAGDYAELVSCPDWPQAIGMLFRCVIHDGGCYSLAPFSGPCSAIFRSTTVNNWKFRKLDKGEVFTITIE